MFQFNTDKKGLWILRLNWIYIHITSALCKVLYEKHCLEILSRVELSRQMSGAGIQYVDDSALLRNIRSVVS